MLYSPDADSWIAHVNPALKLMLMLAGVTFVLCTHNVNVMGMVAILLFLLVIVGSGQPLKRVMLFMLPFFFVFVSTAVSMILFGKGESAWWQWGPILITKESFYRGLHVGFRALSFGFMGLLFAFTTRPVLLFYSLMQQLNVPPRFAYGFMASVRLLPLILQEFKDLKKTYKARGVQYASGWQGLQQKIQLYAVPLLAQSIRRARRIAVAMEARRFNAVADRTYYYQMEFSYRDGLMAVCWIGIFIASWLIGWHVPLVEIMDVRFGG